jgi:adenylosuccinate synthase
MRNSSLIIVILSGAVCSGKSALAKQLSERYAANTVKTRDLILQQKPKTKDERSALQKAGDGLDRDDGGRWVADALFQIVDKQSKGNVPSGLFVVDSVRISATPNSEFWQMMKRQNQPEQRG